MKYYKILFSCLTALLLTNCNEEKKYPIEPTEASQIIPLNVGNKWLGRVERISGSTGEVLSEWSTVTEIVRWTVVDSVKQFIIKYENGQEFNCTNTDSGFVFNHSLGDYLQYKYPAKIGDKYDHAGNAFREVVATDTTIITEYGEFNCYHYSSKIYGSEFHTEYFISPNYGFIYTENYQTDGLPEITLYSRITYQPIILEE